MSRREHEVRPGCPVPFKLGYPSPAHARYALEKNHPNGVGRSATHYYRCECGQWHLAGSPAMVRDTLRKRNHRTKKGPKAARSRRGRRGCL